MFFETHHKMGQLMHDRMERLYPGRISRDAFVYGNVKPDLLRKGAKDRHLLSDTLPFIELTSGFLCTPSVDPEEDAVLLGMVCHHVCDAFCRYHQEMALYRDYPRHLEYELGLNAYFLECLHGGLYLSDEGRVRSTEQMAEETDKDPVGNSAGNPTDGLVPAEAVQLVGGGTPAQMERVDQMLLENGVDVEVAAESPRGTRQSIVPVILRLHVRRAAYAAAEPSFRLDLVSALEACADMTDGILARRFSL